MRLLAIEITPHELRIAHGERRFGAGRLLDLERIPIDGPAALAAALVRLAALRPAVVLSALPAHLATHRLLVLPFRDRRRLAAATPLELLGALPIDSGDLHVAASRLGAAAGGSAVLGVAVRRADLVAHLALLRDARLPPARVDLSPLPVLDLLAREAEDVTLLLADGPRSALVVRRDGRLAGLRALDARPDDPAGFAAEVTRTRRALDAPARLVVTGPDAARLRSALVAAKVGAIEDLTAMGAPGVRERGADVDACAVVAGLVTGFGGGTPAGVALAGTAGEMTARAWRRPAALAAAVLAVALVDLTIVRAGLVRRTATLETAIAAEAAAAMPDLPPERARAALEADALERARAAPTAATSILELLREVSGRVPGTLRLDLDELSVEPDAVRLHGRCDSFDAVDALRRALAASPLLAEVEAEETRTAVDGRGVDFRLRALRRAAAGAPS